MDLIQLGKNISALRRAQHLTQEDVAFELNITNVSYSRIERGITDVSFNRLLQIAQILEKNGEEYMVLKLYDMLIKLRLNPSFKVHNIVMKY